MISITCSKCGRRKALNSFTTAKQRHLRECNTCYFSHSKKTCHVGLATEVSKPRYSYKIVKCLRCGEDFKGGTSIRVCKNCKNTKEYLEAAWL